MSQMSLSLLTMRRPRRQTCEHTRITFFDTNKLYRRLILQRKEIFGFSLLIFQQSQTCALRVRNQRALSLEFLFRSATCRLHNNVPGLHVAYTSHTDDSLQFYRITCPQERGATWSFFQWCMAATSPNWQIFNRPTQASRKTCQADATRIELIETSLKLHCFSMFHMNLVT